MESIIKLLDRKINGNGELVLTADQTAIVMSFLRSMVRTERNFEALAISEWNSFDSRNGVRDERG